MAQFYTPLHHIKRNPYEKIMLFICYFQNEIQWFNYQSYSFSHQSSKVNAASLPRELVDDSDNGQTATCRHRAFRVKRS